MSDIIIIAKLERKEDGSTSTTFSLGSGSPGSSFYQSRTVSEDGTLSGSDIIEFSVGVENTKGTDAALMQSKARALAAALASAASRSANNSGPDIVVLGRRTGFFSTYVTLMNTRWYVTDRSFLQMNRGLGASNFDTGEDYVSIDAIDEHSAAVPGHPEQGLDALVFHEVTHLTVMGNNFFVDSYTVYDKDQTQPPKYYDSNYAPNVKQFADDMMQHIRAANGATGSDLAFRPTGRGPAIEPTDLYQRNTGSPYPG